MEFTAAQIARLVLGYLKTEKCNTAFDAFFNKSPYFEYSNHNKVRSKYIVTRIQGNSLRDFLNEYAQIYNLVQERLEPTDYYEECSSRNIVDQLIYLLDKSCTRQNTPQRSRSSTPIKEANKNRGFFPQNLSVIDEHFTPELNTTPLEALPGNSQEFSSTPKKRTGIKTNKNTLVEDSDSGDNHDNSQEEVEDLEVLKQTLLERTEWHEKIAENINLVINTAENTKIPEETMSNELESAIKAIVEKTEADPIFEKLIGDLIGSTNENGEINQDIQNENALDLSRSIQLPSEIPETSNGQDENDSETITQRLRNPRKQGYSKLAENTSSTETKSIQTNILAETKLTQTDIPHNVNTDLGGYVDTTQSNVHQNLTVNTNTGDVILYNGTLDTYVKNSTPQVLSSINPIFLNNNLLMVQPGLIQQTSLSSATVGGIRRDKSYYVLNNSPSINVSAPQIKLNNVTEQDILNMPTVIVCDNNNGQLGTNRNVRCASTEPPPLFIKGTPEPNLRDYITQYQCSDGTQSPLIQSKSQPNPQKKETTNNIVQIEIIKSTAEGKQINEITNNVIEKDTESNICEKPSSPRAVTPDRNKQSTRKTTPKSGSHIRALDFNLTPGHSNLTANKKSSSSNSAKKKTPTRLSATKISKSLFGSPSKSVKFDNGDMRSEKVEDDSGNCTKNRTKSKSSGSWDSDLRALMGPVKEPTPPKKKKKESKRSSKKAKPNLNNTETDAKSIEANLAEMNLQTNPIPAGELNKEQDENIPIKDDVSKEGISGGYVDRTENYDDQGVYTVTLINCNAKSKFKKKCNIDNNISKAVKITKVKEFKPLEIVPDGSHKLILSPSKLNANKRSLVENSDKEISLVVASTNDDPSTSIEAVVKSKIKDDAHPVDDLNGREILNENLQEKSVEEDKNEDQNTTGKLITPEMARIPNVLPITANRNLTPMLETPLKFMDTSMKLGELPRTPGANIPSNDTITPMTKMLNEQLHGIDLLSMPTPKFPLTPILPITPFNTKSPYPNRSTDYSTTSSYYQPSDSEQNKSLEALLEECKRLEFKKLPSEKQINQPITSSIAQKISTFNQTVIARKNLNLVKKDLEDSSSDQSTSVGEDSSINEDTNSSGSLWVNSNNDTVIKRAETPYMLRPRKKDENTNPVKMETNQDTPNEPENKSELKEYTVLNRTETILKEIEEKRKRTIAKFKKSEEPPPPKKTPCRDSHGKFKPKAKPKSRTKSRKTLPMAAAANVEIKNTKRTTNKRKSKSPVKLSRKANVDVTTEIDGDVMLHISSDDDQIKPFDVVETELLEFDSSSTYNPLNTFQKALDSFKSNLIAKEAGDNVSDQEAKILVEGLKERGIYLVPNKTPQKTDKHIETCRGKTDDKTNKSSNPQRESEVLSSQIADKNNQAEIKSDILDSGSRRKSADLKITDIKGSRRKRIKSRPNIPDKSAKSNDVKTDTPIVRQQQDIKSVVESKTDSVKEKSNKPDKKEVNDGESSKQTGSKSESKNKTSKPNQSIDKSEQQKKNEDKRPSSKKLPVGDNTIKSEDKSKETTPSKLDHPKQADISQSKSTVDNTMTSNEQSLNVPDEEIFDDIIIAEETIKLIYEPNNGSNKTLKDYELPMSNKCFVVEVYGQQIEMSITPFEMIFDMPERKSNEKVRILQNTQLTPLNKLYNDLIEPSTKIVSASPLDNLYSDSVKVRYPPMEVQRLKSKERRRNSTDQKIQPEIKSRKTNRSKSIDCNSILSVPGKEENIIEEVNIEEISSTKLEDKKESTIGQIEDVDALPPNLKSSPREIDDELMNYAICGSERVEDDTEDKGRSLKRKGKDDVDEPSSKKPKYQELLKSVNVDEFLTQLHGGS